MDNWQASFLVRDAIHVAVMRANASHALLGTESSVEFSALNITLGLLMRLGVAVNGVITLSVLNLLFPTTVPGVVNGTRFHDQEGVLGSIFARGCPSLFERGRL